MQKLKQVLPPGGGGSWSRWPGRRLQKTQRPVFRIFNHFPEKIIYIHRDQRFGPPNNYLFSRHQDWQVGVQDLLERIQSCLSMRVFWVKLESRPACSRRLQPSGCLWLMQIFLRKADSKLVQDSDSNIYWRLGIQEACQ